MTIEQELEGNKLIAEFMGNRYIPDGDSIWFGGKLVSLSDLYYLSWDWLMPVVEKIEGIKGVHCVISGLGCDIYYFGKQISNAREETKILTVWLAVVEFIKWYNQNNR